MLQRRIAPLKHRLIFGCVLLSLGALAACGQGTSGSQANQSPPASASAEPSGVAPSGGDIPDNQVYLAYAGAGFTIQYPEGWVQTVRSDGVNFQDKDNRIALTIRQAGPPTIDSVRAEVRAISGASVSADAHRVSLPAGAAVLITYQVDGPVNPVTAKRPRLSIDRYELGLSGKLAVIELGSPVGADNVDAYRMIAESFRWR
jgi:hypothetical protein